MAENNPSFLKIFGRWLFTWVSVIASIATIAGLWIQAREGPPEITGIIETQERLTTPSSESKLKVSYFFEGKEVNHLWRIRLTLRHKNGQTVIGTGPKQNLIGPYLPVRISARGEILAMIVDKNDINAVVSKISPTEISTTFDQWRKGETVTIVLYLETAAATPLPPTTFSSGRSIIDGEVVYQTASEAGSSVKRPLVDYLPGTVATTVRIFLTLLLIAFMFAGLHGIKTSLREHLQQQRDWVWFTLYGEKAKKHLLAEIGEAPYSMIEAEHFIVAPSNFVRITGKKQEDVWSTFSEPAPTSLSDLRGSKRPSKTALVGAYIGFAMLVLTAIAVMSVTWSY